MTRCDTGVHFTELKCYHFDDSHQVYSFGNNSSMNPQIMQMKRTTYKSDLCCQVKPFIGRLSELELEL